MNSERLSTVDSIEEYSFVKSELKEKLLPLLMQKVFHVTPYDSFIKIMKDGVIKGGSEVGRKWYEDSFNRKNGYVSLFDFRDKDQSIIDDALNIKLSLSQFGKKIAVLILNELQYSELITYEHVRAKVSLKEKLIPYVESWYPKAIPLGSIEEVIVINIE